MALASTRSSILVAFAVRPSTCHTGHVSRGRIVARGITLVGGRTAVARTAHCLGVGVGWAGDRRASKRAIAVIVIIVVIGISQLASSVGRSGHSSTVTIILRPGVYICQNVSQSDTEHPERNTHRKCGSLLR